MLVALLLRQLQRCFALRILRVQRYLLRQEKQENVDVTTHCSHMQISEVLGVFLHWVGSVVINKEFYYFVGAILDSQSQQFMPIAMIVCIQ